MPIINKTDAQLSDLLTDYGIKHGPVVNSTRSLYERKLEEAMAKDRTFYREEEEEITYIICRHPRRKKTSAQFLPGSEQNGDQPLDQAEEINQSSSYEPSDDLKLEQLTEMDQESSTELDQQTQQNLHLVSVKTSHTTTSHSKLKVKGPIRRQSAGKTRMVIPAVLVLTGLAAGCYYALPTVM
ncbi:emerin (Emery-Dreifuss muscular dystrophy) [Poecilia reticulata]|uniref:emerin (Emery-Dreifuss muscular dystrophy) n=1 Tax=Poecilia reticulata TaxID=8081 RepID=UPI0004A47642|nr:PREDICTED: emerin homolog 1-like [Poecilia reticulata]